MTIGKDTSNNVRAEEAEAVPKPMIVLNHKMKLKQRGRGIMIPWGRFTALPPFSCMVKVNNRIPRRVSGRVTIIVLKFPTFVGPVIVVVIVAVGCLVGFLLVGLPLIVQLEGYDGMTIVSSLIIAMDVPICAAILLLK